MRRKRERAKIDRPAAASPCGLRSGAARPAPAGCSACVFVCVLYVKGGGRGNDCCGWGLGAGIRASNPWLCVRENLAA